MARLRQQHPQNYTNSGNISTEFENVVRYINAAELGSKTIGELLAVLFDENGEFDGPIEFRLDAVDGLQYRIGEYENAEDGWITLAALSDIRGPSGQNVGTVEGPFFYNRADSLATAGQTVISYTFDEASSDVVVYINGLLQATSAYTKNIGANTITMGSPLALNDKITIFTIRSQSVSNFRRTDFTASASQSVFAFVHTADEQLLVWKNGILQRSGGANDYTSSFESDTITFTSPCSAGDKITVMTVENLALQNVAGLMLESEYTDVNGRILYSKLSIADGEITQAKVSGLVAALASASKMTVSDTTPVGPSTGDFWLDTSSAPNKLKFFDGTQWLLTSPESSLPTFNSTQANKYVRVNGSGSALEFGDIDFSTLVPKTFMGAANGVASLDSAGKLPTTQLPEIFSARTIFHTQDGTVTNGTKLIGRLYKEKIRIDGLTAKMGTGTCSIQLSVDGVTVGAVFAVTTTASDQSFGSVIEIDATSASRRLEIVVTSAAGTPANLEVGLAAVTLSA